MIDPAIRQAAHRLDAVAVTSVDEVGGAELARKRLLGGLHVDCDDPARAGKTCAGNDIEPYPAHADHRDRIARLYGGGVDRGASSGYASAAQDRSLREGQFFRYFGKLVLVHQRIFGEGRCAEDGCDGLAIARQSRRVIGAAQRLLGMLRSEEHTSELQSLMRISYAVFCLKKK